MRMRTLSSATVLVIAAFAAGIATSRYWPQGGQLEHGKAIESASEDAEAGGESKTWFTCGMHPEVVQDHPGDCPKCGMHLQPMAPDRAAAMGLDGARAPGEWPAGERKILYWKSSMIPGEIHKEPGEDSMGMELIPVYADEVSTAGAIRIDPVTEQNMGIRLGKVISGPLVKTIRTVGLVDYDETTLASVTTKVDGWVEKLYVDETGSQVHKGDSLLELYSPELFSAQEEYLSARRNLRTGSVETIPRARIDSEALVRDARTRLEYFDVTPAQIAQLDRTGEVRKTLTIHSPFTGIVTHKNVVEGQRINAGSDLFRIADLSTVWVIGKVFEYDLPFVRLGQEVLMTLSYLPGKTFRGRVTYVYPYLEEKTREIPVRIEFHNPGYELKPGMYATLSLSGEIAKQATLVPDVAVIKTGARSIVFTTPEPGRFELREVKTGARGENNYLHVLSGVAPGESVVVSGQFLLDSESRLREAALKFMEPSAVNAAAAETGAPATAGGELGHRHEGVTEETYYVCPMPEHVDILYEQPGQCPICGMRLAPVTRREGHVENPAIDHWTCPMPEHASVRKEGPGKCPICGMSLVPVPVTSPPAASSSDGGDSHVH